LKITAHGNTTHRTPPPAPASPAGAEGRCSQCACRFELEAGDDATWARLQGYRGEVYGWVTRCPECGAPVSALPKKNGGPELEKARTFVATVAARKGG
jgi:hypothetical protein